MEKYDLKHFDYHLLRTMNWDQEKELAQEIRQDIILSVAHNGGHLSSNLGVVELTMALLNVYDPYKDDILFDVGHQSYTYKILTGRDISTLRQKDGISGFQDMAESKADKFEAGHSSTSLSIGLGMAAAKKLAGITDSATVIVIGDSSIANGLAFEALNNLDDQKYGKVIIVVNDNNMSISKPKGSLTSFFNGIRTSVFYQEGAGRFKHVFDRKGLHWLYKMGVHGKNFIKRVFTRPNFFDCFNCKYLGPIDGHDLKKLTDFINRANSLDSSVILHVRTKKGKGYHLAEDDDSGYWHGTSQFDVDSGLPLNFHPESVSLSHLSGNLVCDILSQDPKAVLIVAAMVKGAHLEAAFKSYPERCYDVGIAEEHAVELAAGMSLKGYYPIISIYSTFMQRTYDQLVHDLCRMKLASLILVDRAGLVGADGSSHQGIFDVDMVLGMPNTVLYNPCDGNMLKADIAHIRSNPPLGPVFVRIERDFISKKEDGEEAAIRHFADYTINKADSSFKTAVLLGCEGKSIMPKLKGKANLVLLNGLKPFNHTLLDFLLTQKEIYVYDPTSSEIGFASYLSFLLHQAGYQGIYMSLALPDSFIDKGTKIQQLEQVGLSSQKALKWFDRMLKKEEN